eukprot:6197417-Amphidinium_carterae.1
MCNTWLAWALTICEQHGRSLAPLQTRYAVYTWNGPTHDLKLPSPKGLDPTMAPKVVLKLNRIC